MCVYASPRRSLFPFLISRKRFCQKKVHLDCFYVCKGMKKFGVGYQELGVFFDSG